MKTLLAIALSLALPAAAAKEEMQVRNQGVVKARVWLTAAELESARVNLRVLTALSNDATAWDSQQAGAVLKDAKEDLTTARMHARGLKSLGTTRDAAEDLNKLDADLGNALTLVDRLQAPVARGVSPKNAHTQADNTMLGGAASDRGMAPGKGGEVTRDSGRGQRGGTAGVQQLRDGIKAAWDKLDQARSDLDKVARAYDTTAKLPEP
jgi:hypothetical protein